MRVRLAGWRRPHRAPGRVACVSARQGRTRLPQSLLCERWRPARELLAGRAGNPVRCMCGGRWRRSRARTGRSACANGPGAIMQDCSSLRAFASWSSCGCMVEGSGLPAAWLSHAVVCGGRSGACMAQPCSCLWVLYLLPSCISQLFNTCQRVLSAHTNRRAQSSAPGHVLGAQEV